VVAGVSWSVEVSDGVATGFSVSEVGGIVGLGVLIGFAGTVGVEVGEDEVEPGELLEGDLGELFSCPGVVDGFEEYGSSSNALLLLP
jgi:hypothetical protein